VNFRSPTTIFLNRARLIFMLTALLPTVLMTAIGVILLASGGSQSFALIGGILVLAFCATALTGYTLGTIFVKRGASLAAVQNEFLSSVSHELRTPLTSMRMFIDTLREERVSDPADRQRCLAVVNQELTRLDGLVGKLIELSKIESRHAAFDRQPVSVSEVVADALAVLEASKLGDGIDLRVTVEPDLVINADRGALVQALGNLLVNAWKYGPQAEKRIEVSAVGDLRHVSITVSDNGVGIPRPEQEVIFEKFQRGSAALESGAPGTGLGLAIVRAIVEAHRGKVSVRSDLEHGSRFRIVLPRHRPERA
jgi:two-component system phosphate regulon sensor histidine kinase PhoR